MKTLRSDELERKLVERYNDHPLDWKCIYTVDRKGNYGIGWINTKLSEQYWIKFSSPYSPRSIGFISTLNENFPFLNDPLFNKDFGFRFVQITDEERKKMARSGRMIASVLKKVRNAKKRSPEPVSEVSEGIVGPYLDFAISLEDISPAQRKLEKKMQDELERLDNHYLSYIR